VYRSAVVWHLGLVYVAFGFSYIIYMTFFTKHLIAEGGYTQEAAGRLFMTMGWFSLLCGLIWGTLSDVIGRKRALIMVYLIHAGSFGLFAWWPAPPGFTLSAILFGLSAWSPGRAGIYYAFLRHRAGPRAERCRRHGGRRPLVLPGLLACRRGGSFGRLWRVVASPRLYGKS
jgi:MFS family permease